LVDLIVSGHPNSPQIQLFVDHPEGVTVKLCTELSRKLSEVIDREMNALNNYRLEVSSPGLDRHLKTEKDFTRHVGQMVKIYYTESGNNKSVTGNIEAVCDHNVILVDGDDQISVAIGSIQKAKIKLKW